MRHVRFIALGTCIVAACGGGQPAQSPSASAEPHGASAEPPGASGESLGTESDPAATPAADGQTPNAPPSTDTQGSASAAAEKDPNKPHEFVLQDTPGTAKQAHGASASKLRPTRTEAALKFFVVDKDKGPIPGVVICLTAPNGTKYYTVETDSTGYTEVLVPVGLRYGLVYLSLGQADIAATVPVSNEPNQNVKLTLRYKGYEPEQAGASHFVLDGINFDTGKATLRAESFPRLDSILEYLVHKPSKRIEISGHTDNVGNPKSNKALSEKRAQACRDYLVSKGIDASRIHAVGYGDSRPLSPNDSDENRQKNRRIEATPL